MLLLAPTLVVFLLVTGYPVVQLLVSSFQNFGRRQIFGAPPEFVAFDNYTATLTDPYFWQVMGRSVLFCIVNATLTMVIGFAVALLLRRLGRAMRMLVSVGLILAWAMPALTITVVWGWLFDTSYGLVNYLLTQLPGLDFTGHSWLIEPLSFFTVATVIVTWQSVPFVAFTIYAGLTQIPEEIIEAAQIDGASARQRLWHVTVPYLRPILLVLTVLQIIWDLRVFTQIYALQTLGGIKNETATVGVYIYQTAINGGNYGLGGAIGILLMVVLAGLAVYYIRATLKNDEEA